jgi:catechol 2,3-dioxygenase-like lactoylglutathione lyase family enzyme
VTLQRLETGIVSTDRALVDFYAEVFGLEPVEPDVYPTGTLHRLVLPGGFLKVFVPNDLPAPGPATERWTDITGIRYFTARVDDLDDVVDRALTRGGALFMPAFELRPGVRLAIVTDPDGNTIEIAEGAD